LSVFNIKKINSKKIDLAKGEKRCVTQLWFTNLVNQPCIAAVKTNWIQLRCTWQQKEDGHQCGIILFCLSLFL
jgi:hypothetical protein